MFTRREPASVQMGGAAVFAHDALESQADGIDVFILCGGSKNDLPAQSPTLAARFIIIDSFDTHARVTEHFAAVDAAARATGTTVLISAGWDPGMFSMNRLGSGAHRNPARRSPS